MANRFAHASGHDTNRLGHITLAVNGYTQLTRGGIPWEYIAMPITLAILIGLAFVAL